MTEMKEIKNILDLSLSLWVKYLAFLFQEAYAYEEREALLQARKVMQKMYGISKEEYPLFLRKKINEFPLPRLAFFEKTRAVEDKENFYKLFVQEVKKKRPWAYLLGESDFRSFWFYTNESTLIPRVDSEVLVDKAKEFLESIFSLQNEVNVLELCTGTGALGFSLFLELTEMYGKENLEKKMKLTMTDCSEEVLLLAKRNQERYALESTKLLKSDVFEQIPVQKYDCIFLNPPYIKLNEKKFMPESVLLYEPSLALFSGEKGLDFFERFFEKLSLYVKEGSVVYMEIGFQQAEEVKELVQKFVPHVKKTEVFQDFSGQERVLALMF